MNQPHTDAFRDFINEKKHMNRFVSLFKPLMWFMALLLAAFVAGCGDGGGGGGGGSSGPGGGVCVGAACVPLGTAGTFVILTKAGITDVPASAITGNVGASPISGTGILVTCAEVTGTIYSVDAAGPLPCRVTNAILLNMAVNDAQTASVNASGRPPTSAATTDVGGGTLTSLTLAPGVYAWGTNVTIPTDLTLNGNATDVWIFKVAGTLDMAAAKNVILSGGAKAKNVFWAVTSTVAIGANTQFKGVILSAADINLGTGASIDGRLFAITAVNLDHNTVTRPAL